MSKRKNKGITLIALVITIIVMLVLVGVTLSVTLGEDGIIGKAIAASRRQKQKEEEENNYLNEISEQIAGLLSTDGINDPSPGELETTDDETYYINSAEDLVAFSNSVNSGTSYEGKIVVLDYSLDIADEKSYVNSSDTELFGDYNGDGETEGIKEELTKVEGRGFIPIGNEGNTFRGMFSGNNKSIQNILINVTGSEERLRVGLFGLLNGTVKDLTLSGNVKATNNSTSTTSRIYIGGITGELNTGSIESCNNMCTISETKNIYSYVYAGGIVGNNYNSEINGCSNYGEFNIGGGRDYTTIGGICGTNSSSTILYCVNYAKIENTYEYSTSSTYNGVHIGGITGINYSIIKYSSNLGNVISNGGIRSTTMRTAGVAGISSGGTIEFSYNRGTISANGKINSAAGACYNFVGGLCGESAASSYFGNCYNTGNITAVGADSNRAKGITGALSSTTISKCFYLNTSANDSYGTKKTESEMKDPSFASALGGNFKAVENNYPEIAIPEYRAKSVGIATGTETTLSSSISANSGDLVIAAIMYRTINPIITSGWTTLNPNMSLSESGSTQYVMFAYKKMLEDGIASIDCQQSSAQRCEITLIVIPRGKAPTLLDELETTIPNGSADNYTITLPEKPCDEMIIYACSTILSGASATWETAPSTIVEGITVPRLGVIIDKTNSGTVRTITKNFNYAGAVHICAIKVPVQ